jgi:hypothetical protein
LACRIKDSQLIFWLLVGVLTTCRAVVPGSSEDGLALRSGLVEEALLIGDGRRVAFRLAKTPGRRDDLIGA